MLCRPAHAVVCLVPVQLLRRQHALICFPGVLEVTEDKAREAQMPVRLGSADFAVSLGGLERELNQKLFSSQKPGGQVVNRFLLVTRPLHSCHSLERS